MMHHFSSLKHHGVPQNLLRMFFLDILIPSSSTPGKLKNCLFHVDNALTNAVAP
jgi:hypothetical protein